LGHGLRTGRKLSGSAARNAAWHGPETVPQQWQVRRPCHNNAAEAAHNTAGLSGLVAHL